MREDKYLCKILSSGNMLLYSFIKLTSYLDYLPSSCRTCHALQLYVRAEINIALRRAIYFPTIGTPPDFMLAKHEPVLILLVLNISFIGMKVNQIKKCNLFLSC